MVPRRILHLGANNGQEAKIYAASGIEGWHVEAIPKVFDILQQTCATVSGQTAIHACLDAEAGRQIEFNVASNGESSSILGLGRHAAAYPHIAYVDKISLTTNTVDALIDAGTIPSDIDFAVLDVQGAEDRALQGAAGFLESNSLWGLLIEVAVEPIYDGGAEFFDLCEKTLRPKGFYLKGVQFNAKGWSDALFLRRWWPRHAGETPPLLEYCKPEVFEGRNIAPEGSCTQSSTSRWSKEGEAARATSAPLTGRFTFHTDWEENPWWKVDFGAPRRIDEIVCFNRLDACSDRASSLVAEVSDDDLDWTIVHRNVHPFGGHQSGTPPLRIACEGTTARFVRLKLDQPGFLHLDGVRIYDRTAKP